MRPGILGLAVASLLMAPAATATDGPAASMAEVRDQFAHCLHLPEATAASRPTFYFSLTHDGRIVARPRLVLFGFKGTNDARRRATDAIERSFAACLPVRLTRQMAASLPGKVFFLQYVVSPKAQTIAVLFRPFGSHGGGYSPLPLEPREDGFIPPNPPLDLRPPPPRPVARPLPPPSPEIFLAPKGRVIR